MKRSRYSAELVEKSWKRRQKHDAAASPRIGSLEPGPCVDRVLRLYAKDRLIADPEDASSRLASAGFLPLPSI